MEGAGGGGSGSIQQAMIQSQMAKESGGGKVANITEPIKGVNTSVVSVQTGNIDQLGQQTGGAMGLLSGNLMEGMLKLSEVSAFGLPNLLGEMHACQSELAETASKVGNVLRLEGVSPPESQGEGLILSPGATPTIGHSAGHSMEH